MLNNRRPPFDTKLKDLMPWFEEIISGNKWNWFNAWEVKYVNIRIDTRSGGMVYIRDDNGKQLNAAELMKLGLRNGEND